MKKLLFPVLCVMVLAIGTGTVYAQKFSAVPKSPLGIVYAPFNASTEGKTPQIKLLYSRPAKNGREIFGKLVKYGEVWRAGANEQTEIRFYKPAVVSGKTIPAGTYSLFIVPEKDSWTFVINKQTDHWGAYSYDKSMDVVRAKVPVKVQTVPTELFSMTFVSGPSGEKLVAAWDTVVVELPISL